MPARYNLLDLLERGLSAVRWNTNCAPNQRRRRPHRFSRSAIERPPNPSDGSPSALALRRPLLQSPAREHSGTQRKPRLRLLSLQAARGPGMGSQRCRRQTTPPETSKRHPTPAGRRIALRPRTHETLKRSNDSSTTVAFPPENDMPGMTAGGSVIPI